MISNSFIEQKDSELKTCTQMLENLANAIPRTQNQNSRQNSTIQSGDDSDRKMQTKGSKLYSPIDIGEITTEHATMVGNRDGTSKDGLMRDNRGVSTPGRKGRGKVTVRVNESGEVCVG